MGLSQRRAAALTFAVALALSAALWVVPSRGLKAELFALLAFVLLYGAALSLRRPAREG